MINKYIVNKIQWPDGPWLSEPDFSAWIDEKTLYPCIADRMDDGVWSGWVGVSPNTPYFLIPPKTLKTQLKINNITSAKFHDIYSSYFHPPSKYWWIGIICNKQYDYIPNKVETQVEESELPTTEPRGVKLKAQQYKTHQFILEKIQELALQLYNEI